MNILSKRPLSIIIALMLSAFFIYANSRSATIKIILLSLSAVALIALFIISSRFKKRLLFQKVTIGCILFTLIFCHVYFDLWFKAYERTGDEEVFITGEVTELKRTSSYNTNVTVKTDKLEGYSFSRYKINFFIPQSAATRLEVGAEISFKAKLCEFKSDDSFDGEHYYFSKGYNSSAEDVGEIEVTKYGSESLSRKFDDYRTTLSRRAIMLTDYESGSLLSALLLGEKENLPSQQRLDFTRTGLSHALALSGMHLAILSLGIEKLLRLLKFGKKTVKASVIVFVVLYMALVGFPISVVRAGIMLILASLFYLTVGSKDSFTNLLLAVLVICFISPYSIYSTSLWLSAFATLGIIVLSELFENKYVAKPSILKRFAKWCIVALLSSIFAIGATFFIMAIYFDGFSWISIFINPVFSVLLEIYMYVGSLALILGSIIPFNFIISPLRKIIFALLSYTSDIELGYLSINFVLIKVLIVIFTIAFFLFIILKLKHKMIYATVLLVLFCSIYVSGILLNYSSITTDEILYSSSKNSDTVIAKSDGEVMIIETGNNTNGAIYDVINTLSELNITKIDAYTVTHYSSSLIDSLDKLLSRMKTDLVYLPYPENNSEISVANAIMKNIKSFRCELKFYKNDIPLKLNNLTFVRKYGNIKENSPIKVAYTLTHLNRTISYLSSGMLENSTKQTATELMAKSNAIILGHYGKKYTKLYFIDEEFEKVGLFILSGTRVAFRQSTLQYYHSMGSTVALRPSFYRLYVE